MRFFWIAVLFAATALAQTKGRVEGRVVTTSGKPVPKATVRLQAGNQSYVEASASDGSFVAEGLEAGTYSVSAQRPGFNILQQLRFTMAAGETRRDVEIRMVELVLLTGSVVDQDGDAVPNATLRLVPETGSSGYGISSTDERGQFRLAAVQPGRYYLVAFSDGYGSANETRGRSALQSNLITYYPGSPTLSGAKLLDLRVPMEGIRVSMLRGRNFVIRGTLTGLPEGKDNIQRTGITISYLSGEPVPLNSLTMPRQAEGFVSVPLPPGEYLVSARFTNATNSSQPLVGFARVKLTNADLDNVVIPMGSGLPVSGRILVEGIADVGSFLQGVMASNGSGFGGGRGPTRPNLAFTQANPIPNSGQTSASIGPDGTFSIPGLLPVAYRLATGSFSQGVHVKSVRLNGEDVTGQSIDFGSAKDATLEILLSRDVGSLIVGAPPGLLPDASGVVTMHHSVWPAVPIRSIQGGRVNTGSSSRPITATGPIVSMSSLPPGGYFVVLWEELPPGELGRNPDFLASLNDVATRFTIESGRTATVMPKVITREELKQVVSR